MVSLVYIRRQDSPISSSSFRTIISPSTITQYHKHFTRFNNNTTKNQTIKHFKPPTCSSPSPLLPSSPASLLPPQSRLRTARCHTCPAAASTAPPSAALPTSSDSLTSTAPTPLPSPPTPPASQPSARTSASAPAAASSPSLDRISSARPPLALSTKRLLSPMMTPLVGDNGLYI